MTESPLTPDELRAAAATYHELGPEYSDAVLSSFVERVGKEIDARIASTGGSGQVTERSSQASRRELTVLGGSLGVGLITTFVLVGNHYPITALLVVWAAIAVINIAYAVRRPPGDTHRS
jgi:hypothetical protein